MEKIWFRMAIVYFFICTVAWIICLFTAAGLHAYLFGSIQLIGSLVMWMTGLYYLRRAPAANKLLGKFHFWMYQFGFPPFLMALYLLFAHKAVTSQIVLFSIGIGFLALGTVLFVLNMLQHRNNWTASTS